MQLDPISLLATLLTIQQSSRRSKAEASAARAADDMRTRKIEAAQSIETRKRRERLKKTMATQRARFGASGVGGPGGSSRALLQGLLDQTEDDIADMRKSDLLRIGEIYRSPVYRRGRSLLDGRGSSKYPAMETKRNRD